MKELNGRLGRFERLLEKEMQEKIRKKEMYEPNHV